MELKQGQLVAILGCTKAIEDKWISAINSACAKFSINTKLRLAAFIAQIGHESGRLTAVTENLNFSASGLQSTWPNRFNSAKAQECARQPEKIANVVYSGRMGNASEASGDGWKYRGRGLIQCTGKSNYDAFSQACGVNAVADPDILTQPANAALSAGWFWNSKGLNAYADRGDLLTTTKRINGGTNGQADREAIYKKALIVLSDETPPKEGTEEAKKPVEVAPDATSVITSNKTPPATNASIVEPRSAAGDTAKYPWNAVHESRSGHVIEVDDTPGAERLASTHRTGSYWEINPVGSFTIKSVLDSFKITKEDSSDYVGGSYTQQTKGQSYRQSSGNMIFSTPSEVYFTASMMQFNTGALNVSGEVNASGVNSPIFSGLGSGMAFGNLLAKEALVAYDIKKGKPPMLGGSLGFKGVAGGSEGSADSRVTNNLSTNKPDGSPIVTNGISPVIAAIAAAGGAIAAVTAMTSTSKDLIDGSGSDSDTPESKAIMEAASDLDAKSSIDDVQTPVFLKHVSFDKPTLLSQSTIGALPDPSLYVNNYHTMVNTDGEGELFVSNGESWQAVGGYGKALEYTKDQVGIIKSDINSVIGLVLDESDARAIAFAESALTTQVNLANGLLTEAIARGAAVQAEASMRQTEYESIATRLLEITASTSDAIASGIQVQQQATADLISAEASQRTLLAATVNGHTSSIMEEIETRANQTGELFSQYTIKINQDGYVSGFGLTSTSYNATPYSEFIIMADSFIVASPATMGIAPKSLFTIKTTPSTINGTVIPPGVYMDNSYISVLTADKIDTRGLSIRDANGNIILSAGSSLSDQISDNLTDQLKTNMLDTSSWVINTHDGVPRFNRNGGKFEQYRQSTLMPDGSNGMAWYCYPGLYYNNAYGWDAYQDGGVPAGNNDGGWDTDAFSIDHTKAYRFSVWWKHENSSVGAARLGCEGYSVLSMGTNNLHGDPYFVTINLPGLVVGRWYLAVGYVYANAEHMVSQRNMSGVYDGTSGKKIFSGTDYAWTDTAGSSKHRSYLSSSEANSNLYMTWPRVDMLTGSEPSLSALLSMGSVSARNPIGASNASTYISDLAVDTLQIANNAVTIPVALSFGSVQLPYRALMDIEHPTDWGVDSEDVPIIGRINLSAFGTNPVMIFGSMALWPSGATTNTNENWRDHVHIEARQINNQYPQALYMRCELMPTAQGNVTYQMYISDPSLGPIVMRAYYTATGSTGTRSDFVIYYSTQYHQGLALGVKR